MKIGCVVLALAVASSTAAYAQSRWADPYRNGVKAFEAGRCAEAIPLFDRAVAADPKAEANKRIEGVFRSDYFPYYYLALCYVELQQWDKAAQNLDKARTTLTRQQQAKFAEAETKIKLASAPKPDPRRAAFDAAVAQAESALSGKQFELAIRRFDQIRGTYTAEYSSAGLAAKRDEAVKGYAGRLFDEGRALAQSAKYNDAKAKFQLADQTLPGQKPVTDALADLKKREDEYQRLKTAAQADQNARNYASARDKLEQARTQHPEQFIADNLGARLTEVTALASGGGRGDNTGSRNTGGNNTGNRGGGDVVGPDPTVVEGQRLARSAKAYITQGKYGEADAAYAAALKSDPKNQEALDALAKANRFKALRDRSAQLSKSKNAAGAQQALADARTLDPERFTREGLAAILEKLTPPSADPSRTALQQGLLALLNGRAQESIAILEPALSKSAQNASLHAYLGVAYATQALSAPKPEDRSRLQDKAVEQFKLAKAAQADYQLSTRVVSPAIVKIYEAAPR
jgi:tetratricopeptide (TPR) repeat protein